MSNEKIKLFISYSWDSEEHRLWVKKLADVLEQDELFHVIWDGYDLDSLIDKNLYMEKSVVESDYILTIGTELFKQKADDRLGGVGIETYLSVNEHWENLQKKRKTKSLLILKENCAIPNYLKGHFYIDFTKDDDFVKNVLKLKKQILGETTFKRPEKKKGGQPIELTKTSELIGLFYKNKNLLLSKTDFSKDNRIKYEIWEFKDFSGTASYIISLHPNISIQQSMRSAIEEIKNAKILKTSKFLVLSHRNIKDFSLLSEGYSMVNRKYDDFIWENCVDASLKTFPIPETIDFYTTQEIKDVNGDVYRNAISYLSDVHKNKEQGNSVNIIIGSGGIGKTSLCQSLANKLSNKDKIVVYLSSEDIKNYINENKGQYGSVESLYDFYVMEAKYLEIDNIFDRKTFDACILSGNIIIIIDGLDEFTSIFPEKFDISSFLSSISAFNAELGDSYFILTSRDDVSFSEEYLENLNINKLSLLGFKIDNCTNYLKQRFDKYSTSERIINNINSKIESSSLFEEHRVIPFFVDVISTMYEDNLELSEKNEIHFELSEENTSYPSLNKLNDHLIYSIFKREKRRHNFNESPESMIRTFIDLCSDQHDNWSTADFFEIISISYDKNVELYIDLLKKNPLLKVSKDVVKLRYAFLKSYFTTLELFYYFTDKPINSTFSRILSRVGDDSGEMKSLIEFISKIDYTEKFKKIVDSLKYSINVHDIHYDKERNEKLISLEKMNTILSLLHSSSPSLFSSKLIEMHSSNGTVDRVFINGDVSCIDFSELTIKFSHFRNFPKFLNSTFTNSRFEYCKFHNCFNSNIKNSNILDAKIDRNSCEMNDLHDAINNFSIQAEVSDERVKQDFIKFLGSFYRAGRFRDNKLAHIVFSQGTPRLRENEFDRLLRLNFLAVSVNKSVGVFYEITKEYKPSVRKLIMDDLMDVNMRNIFNWIKEGNSLK